MFSRERSIKNEEFRKCWNQWVASLARLSGTDQKSGGSVSDLQTGQVISTPRKDRSGWLCYIA
jgi:hypothetical protein